MQTQITDAAKWASMAEEFQRMAHQALNRGSRMMAIRYIGRADYYRGKLADVLQNLDAGNVPLGWDVV